MRILSHHVGEDVYGSQHDKVCHLGKKTSLALWRRMLIILWVCRDFAKESQECQSFPHHVHALVLYCKSVMSSNFHDDQSCEGHYRPYSVIMLSRKFLTLPVCTWFKLELHLRHYTSSTSLQVAELLYFLCTQGDVYCLQILLKTCCTFCTCSNISTKHSDLSALVIFCVVILCPGTAALA